MGSTEAQNRFNLVFPKFIRACCSYKHPLVIFLDDLQWVDSATLKLIELMLSDREMQYLFLIGAYRDNEVSQAHPLRITLDKLKQEDVAIHQITLVPLTLESVTQLMTGTFDSCSDAIATRQARATIPPRSNAKILQHGNSKAQPHPKDENLRRVRTVGRKQWKKETGYHRRSLSETTMFRLKTIFGGRLRRRGFDAQAIEPK